MNNLFENNIEEISQIVAKLKKEHNKAIFRLQKGESFLFEQFNSKQLNFKIDSIEGVNMQLYTSKGYTVFGSSDKIYLSDVMTRLHQSLDNTIKASKGHRVDDKILIPNLPEHKSTQINELSNTLIDRDFIENFANKIYSDFPDEYKILFNLKIKIRGEYSIWHIANTSSSKVTFDEFFSFAEITISAKSNTKISHTITELISFSSFNKKELNTALITNRLSLIASILSLKQSKKIAKEITPENIFIDHNIISKLASSTESQEIFTKELLDTNEFIEEFDRNGFKIVDNKSLNVVPKSPIFSEPTQNYNADYEIKSQDSQLLEFSESINNVERILLTLKKQLGKSSLILLSSNSTDINISNAELKLNSCLAVFTDENGTVYLGNKNFVINNTLANIKYIGSSHISLQNTSNPKVFTKVKSFDFAIIPNSNPILVI